MDPDRYGFGFMAAALLTQSLIGLSRRRPVTDADRLKRLDRAEQAAIARANNPHVIAAAQKRERRRLKRTGTD